MDIKTLEQIGLTQGETRAYLALLKLGSTSTGPLIKEAKVSSSKVYKILDRLTMKGLVGYTLKGKIKYFTANSPKRILEYIENKEQLINEEKKTIQKILPELEEIKNSSKNKSKVTLFEGFNSIKNFYNNILDDLKNGDQYFVLGGTYGKEEKGVREFYHNYHLRRIKKKIKVNMLANIELKGKLEAPTLKHSEIKYIPKYLVSNMMVVFYKNKAFIYFLTDEPKGFLIEDRGIVEGYMKYFRIFWKIGKI